MANLFDPTVATSTRLDRPSWDEYLYTMAIVVGSRSLDPATKCGCVIVDTGHSILTTGYNSPPRGIPDQAVPLTRPEKYPYFVHAEEAAIANAARNGVPVKGGIAYITGPPCPVCLRMMINAGIAEIVYGQINHSSHNDPTEMNVRSMMVLGSGIQVRVIEVSPVGLLSKCSQYYLSKTQTQVTAS